MPGRGTGTEGGVFEGEVAGVVLGHDIDGGGGRDGSGEKVEDGGRAGQVFGQDQMAYEQAANGQAIADLEVADLTVHLDDGGAVGLGVVAGGGELFGGVGVGVFHVGHVDVDEAVEQTQGVEVVVAAGIVNNGDRQFATAGFHDGLGNWSGEVRGGNEVDIDATETLKVEHDLGELIDGEVAAATAVADVGILAEDAAEIAAGKEDRARSAGADEDGFFAEVRAGRADAGSGADAAKTGLLVAAMGTAATGTEGAGVDFGGQGVQGRLEAVERCRVGAIDGFHGNPSPNRIRSFWRTLPQKRRKVKGNYRRW
jgi:hypothetical protein